MDKFTEKQKTTLAKSIDKHFSEIFAESSTAVPTNPIAACKYIVWALIRKVGIDLPKKKRTEKKQE